MKNPGLMKVDDRFPKEIFIHLNGDDILAGKRQNCTKCPIALAASRAFGPYMVDNEYIATCYDHMEVVKRVPGPHGNLVTRGLAVYLPSDESVLKMARFVKNFDKFGPDHPCCFPMQIHLIRDEQSA